MPPVRLQRYLSQAGVAARRKAEQLITAGRVKVNGRVVRQLGTTVDPDTARVTVDDQAVHPQELFYCVLNKPKGSITAVSDPENRRTVMEYLPNLPVPVAPVGRLDYYSEGVLLLTNDGELSAALQAPRTHVEKTYHVKLRGRIKDAHIEAMRRGVRLDDGRVTRPAQVDRLGGAKSKHDWLVITLTEGRSRQIHRMAEALGYQVLKLQRVAFGTIDFHGLRVGDARELTQAEVSELYRLVGLPKNPRASARGRWRARREDTDEARRARDRARAEGAAEPAAEPPRTRSGGPARARSGEPARARSGGPARARSGEPARARSRERDREAGRDRTGGRAQDRRRAPATSRSDRPRPRAGARGGARTAARGRAKTPKRRR